LRHFRKIPVDVSYADIGTPFKGWVFESERATDLAYNPWWLEEEEEEEELFHLENNSIAETLRRWAQKDYSEVGNLSVWRPWGGGGGLEIAPFS
jgi:hypothetical protein